VTAHDSWWAAASVQDSLIEWTGYGEGRGSADTVHPRSQGASWRVCLDVEARAAIGRSPAGLALALEVAGKTKLPELESRGTGVSVVPWSKKQSDAVLETAPSSEAATGSVTLACMACADALRSGAGLGTSIRIAMHLALPDPVLLGLRAYMTALCVRGLGDTAASVELGGGSDGSGALATVVVPTDGARQILAACEEAECTLAERGLLVTLPGDED